jgi:HAD superfamily hydrolase (TIGR01509 family)
MPAVLFGSISTIADTSEMQRDAFNKAFEAHGLSWRWDRDEYRSMLGSNGGEQRIADYAAERGDSVDAAAIHATKSELFRQMLADAAPAPRAGVVDTIRDARDAGLKVGFVTTTSPENVTAVLTVLEPEITRSDFAVITDSTSVDAAKPDGAVYASALATLGEAPGDCVAIEDNPGGVASAAAAGVACIAFPNANTSHLDFAPATSTTSALDLSQVRTVLGTR